MVVFTLIFCSQQQGPLRSENARLAILNNTIRAAKSSRNHELKLLTLICVDHGRGTSSQQGWRDKFTSGWGKARKQEDVKQNSWEMMSRKHENMSTLLSTLAKKVTAKGPEISETNFLVLVYKGLFKNYIYKKRGVVFCRKCQWREVDCQKSQKLINIVSHCLRKNH